MAVDDIAHDADGIFDRRGALGANLPKAIDPQQAPHIHRILAALSDGPLDPDELVCFDEGYGVESPWTTDALAEFGDHTHWSKVHTALSWERVVAPAWVVPELSLDEHFSRQGLGPQCRDTMQRMLDTGRSHDVVSFLSRVLGEFDPSLCDFFKRDDVKLYITFSFLNDPRPFRTLVLFSDSETPNKTGIACTYIELTLNSENKITAVGRDVVRL